MVDTVPSEDVDTMIEWREQESHTCEDGEDGVPAPFESIIGSMKL